MTGETDLPKLLAGMRPSLSETAFGFASIADARNAPAGIAIVGTFIEDEGVTLIGAHDELGSANLDPSGPWAKITLRIHSSLQAVGLTASIASALADRGISANMIAAYFHDHVFVPWEKRHLAMAILEQLADKRR